jgi:predicted transposase YdaD
MAQFDATLKALLEESPTDWPRLVGYSAERVTVIDADISTVGGAADKVLRVDGEPDWIMHLEFQAGPDAAKPRRLNVYNAILEDRHQLLVRSVLVLLRPEANLAAINGGYDCCFPGDARPYRTFRYGVLRVWQLPPDRLLDGGIGVLPLAPIGAVTAGDLPAVLAEMRRRMRRLPERGQVERLWTATYVLMGLRYDESFVEQLLQGVLGMEESVTYQAIIRKGAIQEAKRMLLRQGRIRFGAAGKRAQAALAAINDVDQLEKLGERLLAAPSWEELLSLPARRSRRGPSANP